LAHHSTKLKQWRLPIIKGYILKYRVPPLWPTYIGERRTTFAKAYGVKARCYGEHIGEYIENLMGTYCKLKRNMVGTHWEPEKVKNKSFPPTKLKREKSTFSACLGLLIGSMKFLFPKEFVTIFGLG
jgi:hypothetical protein